MKRQPRLTVGWVPKRLGNLAAMDLDQAIRHAATIDDKLTARLVQRVVNDFLDQLALAPFSAPVEG